MATFFPTESLLVAAPPTLLRHGLQQTLREACPDYPVSFTIDPTRLPELLRQQAYRLVIIDATALPAALLPPLLLQVRSQHTGLPLLILTGRRCPLLLPALRGLRLLPCQTPPADVARAVTELLAAPSVPRPAWPTRRPAPELSTRFSLRELQVLALVMADLCNAQIAQQLHLSVRTVESHRRALLHKAGVRTPVGLVVRALREGWVST